MPNTKAVYDYLNLFNKGIYFYHDSLYQKSVDQQNINVSIFWYK